ncbi:MAG TPA: hypothetical protein VLH85_08255 [Levilinea sp.]|nr:hypothetical protein [Levilinea sp.]
MQPNKNPNPLERVRYFNGQLLTAEDLEAEQRYFREKLKRHNRHLHGSGIVYGLEVGIVDRKVHVSPGFALDCTGEEIAVPEALSIDPPEGQRTAFLMIAYKERKTGTIPGPGSAEDETISPSRIEETFELLYEPDDPYAGHKGDDAMWVPCNRPHALPLAKLFHRWDAWEIDAWFEPPSIPH